MEAVQQNVLTIPVKSYLNLNKALGLTVLFHSRQMVKTSNPPSLRNERIVNSNRRPRRLIRSTVNSVTSWLHLANQSKIQPFCS